MTNDDECPSCKGWAKNYTTLRAERDALRAALTTLNEEWRAGHMTAEAKACDVLRSLPKLLEAQ